MATGGKTANNCMLQFPYLGEGHHRHMRTYRLALIGFGNVGQGLATILRDYGPTIAAQHGADYRIVAVNTVRKGRVYNPEGLDPGQLLQNCGVNQRLDDIPAPYTGWTVEPVSYTHLRHGAGAPEPRDERRRQDDRGLP